MFYYIVSIRLFISPIFLKMPSRKFSDLKQSYTQLNSLYMDYPLHFLPEYHFNHVCRLIIRVTMRWFRGLCTGIMALTLRLRKTPENLSWDTVCWRLATTHRLKWVPLLLNEVGRIAQHVREKQGKKEREAECDLLSMQKSSSPGSLTETTCPEYHVSRVFWLIIKVKMISHRWPRSYLLAFILKQRKIPEKLS